MPACPTDKSHFAPSVSSDGIAGQVTNLNDVHHDVQRLILAELADTSPNDVLKVAQATKTLCDAALPFIYRKVILEQGPKFSDKQKAYQALIERIRQDDRGELSRHIRGITIKDEIPPEDLIMLLDKVARFGDLRWLNWKTSAHMPHTVFDVIHATWPGLELRVAVVDRQHAKVDAHRTVDTRLLSSPLLIELTYVVYVQGYRSDETCRSDWPALSRALAAGGNVRSLRVHSVPDGDRYDGIRVVSDTESMKLPRLDFTSGLRLSQLEELSIQVKRLWGDSTYLWDNEYCRLFSEFIEPSRLRRLDFGKGNPEAFFRSFTGRLPSLESLGFGAMEGASDAAQAFIKSIYTLEHLDIAQAQLAIDDLWPAIEQHRASLRTIILRPALGSYCSAQYVDLSRLKVIATTFPKLERLGWDAPCGGDVDREHLAVLSSMRLKKLDLYLHIPDGANAYSAQLTQDAMGSIAPPQVDEKGCVAAAINIAEVLSGAQQDDLQWLTLHLARTGYSDRYQPYMMYTGLQLRRNAYIGPDRVRRWDRRGDMNWYEVPSLEEEILFEIE